MLFEYTILKDVKAELCTKILHNFQCVIISFLQGQYLYPISKAAICSTCRRELERFIFLKNIQKCACGTPRRQFLVCYSGTVPSVSNTEMEQEAQHQSSCIRRVSMSHAEQSKAVRNTTMLHKWLTNRHWKSVQLSCQNNANRTAHNRKISAVVKTEEFNTLFTVWNPSMKQCNAQFVQQKQIESKGRTVHLRNLFCVLTAFSMVGWWTANDLLAERSRGQIEVLRD